LRTNIQLEFNVMLRDSVSALFGRQVAAHELADNTRRADSLSLSLTQVYFRVWGFFGCLQVASDFGVKFGSVQQMSRSRA
jgi:hypothetical protein